MNAQQLKDQVLNFSNKPKVWVVCGPGGGHGDTLIQEATKHLFGDIDTRFIHGERNVTDSHVIVLGSGGFLDLYRGFGASLARYSDSNDFTILPSTIDIAQVQSIKDKNHQIFCRDQGSHDILVAEGFTSSLCADTVIVSGLISLSPQSDGVVNLYRRDREATSTQKPHTDFDYRTLSYAEWKTKITGAAEVHTDLLHTAILAALAGVETHLYAGASPKQERVWAYSLESLGVQFHAENPTPELNPFLADYDAAAAVFESLPKGVQALWEPTRVAVAAAILQGDMTEAMEILMTTPVIYEGAEAHRQLFLDLFTP